MVSNLDDGDKDVKETTEVTEEGLFKSKICGFNLIMLALMKATLQPVT
jgi:hypothetical protein